MRAGAIVRGVAAAALSLLLCGSIHAQPVAGWLSKFSVHGYLSQAYAVSQDHQIFGIPTNGTTDYRDLALQLRVDQDKHNIFVVQIRQERLGDSPYSHEEDVELDWAFYQRRFSDHFSLKAGRIPLPLGIFNEASGAGATFPFNRPPVEFYIRQYTSKTLEGVLGSMSLDGPGGWSFDADAYGGQWKVDQWGSSNQYDATNAYGGQLWANTPLTGVRVGAGAYRCSVQRGNGSVDYVMAHASVEADLDRWLLATEYISGDLGAGSYRAYYGQAGYQLTKQLSVHARGAVARLAVPRNDLRSTLSRDLGVAVNYAIQPSLLLKLEGHTNQGVLREDTPQNLFGEPARTRYFIATVVATF